MATPVLLVFDGVKMGAHVQLNGELLGTGAHSPASRTCT